MRVRIGTRGSRLALIQAADVARRLESTGNATEIVVITTRGDEATDRAFTDVGAFGIFVRELESALLDGRIDVAVHSYKDLPSQGPTELMIAAVPERLDPADILVANRAVFAPERGMIPLADRVRVGTSAARRTALLRALRPDLEVSMLRGNVPTRIAALVEGKFDAIVLASAGVERLHRASGPDRFVLPAELVRIRLHPAVFTPAPTQGAIALQVRVDASGIREIVADLDDYTIAPMVRAERKALALAEGGCSRPFGAWCRAAPDGALTLTAVLGRHDGSLARAECCGTEPELVAQSAWDALRETADQ